MHKLQDLRLSLDTFENPIFKTHLYCFRWYGYVSSERQRFPIIDWIRCTFFTASIWLSCALMLTRIFQGYENLSAGATSCATAVQYFAVSIALLNAYLQRKRVVYLLRWAHKDLQSFLLEADKEELALLKATVLYVRSITSLLWVPSVLAGLIAFADCIYRTIRVPETVFNMPAVKRGEAQPILLFQLFPFGELFDYFIPGYLGPCYSLFLGITTIPLWHTFITCLMKYANLRLEVLNKRVREMNLTRFNPTLQVEQLNATELTYWQQQLIIDFVEEELKIRQFIRELERLVRIPVMADFIIFSVLICFLFFAFTFGEPSQMDYFFIFLYMFVMSAILWIYHWHATLIMECHKDLAFGYYSCDWYTYSLTIQKTLLFITMNAQRPLIMQALLVELKLRTFIDIVRGAYSYFNILRTTSSR